MDDHEKFDWRTRIHSSRRAYKPSSQPGRLKNGAQKRALSPSQTRIKKGHSGQVNLSHGTNNRQSVLPMQNGRQSLADP